MRIAVTGSIATDHLMTFPGKFTDQLIADKLDKVSLSFLVDELAIRRGGVAANIAFGLGVLGLRPLLVGAVGADFEDYRRWLEDHGVSTAGVRESLLKHTARFVCTTDADGNQIGSFYAGAMSEDADIKLAPLAEEHGGIDLVLIGAGDPGAMVAHTAECRDAGPEVRRRPVPAAGQDPRRRAGALAGRRRGLPVRQRVRGSPDRAQVRLGQRGDAGPGRDQDHHPRLGAAPGSSSKGSRRSRSPPVPDAKPVDPTGSGDAFRSGFLAAVAWGLSLERAAQLGNLMAVHALEATGPQEYNLKPGPLADRFAAAYGDAAAAEVAVHLPV